MSDNRKHVIVMGASMSGLLAARALSEHFENVTIIEKDTINNYPEPRKGQPQSRHVHALLPSGLNILTDYYPELKKELMAHGANEMDLGQINNWYAYGGFKKKITLGIHAMTMSRQLLDFLVRKNTLAIPNIRLQDNTTVEQLLTTQDKQQVVGIEATQIQQGGKLSLAADLVVDAMGRGSRSPRWLKDLGYPLPPESKVKINVTYKTRRYERNPADPRSKDIIIYSPEAPAGKVGVMLLPVEDNQWMLTLAGWHGLDPLPSPEELSDFLKKLPHPDFYDIISHSKPLSDFISYKFTHSQRNYYEKLDRFPSNYLVIGDAIASFNPVYGQGMTSACLQAWELGKMLKENTPSDKLPATYFNRIAKIINMCWSSATVEDFRYPETVGIKPRGVKLINQYMTLVHRASNQDEVVYEAFLKVAGLLKPPTALLAPKVVWRLIRN